VIANIADIYPHSNLWTIDRIEMVVEPVRERIGCVSDEGGQERGKESGRAKGGAVR
jgi:hypothetical protein